MAERKRKMNKLFSKIAALSVGLAMAIGVGVAIGSKEAKVAKADNQTITFNTTNSQITATGTDKTITESGVTLTFSNISGISSSDVQNAKSATIISTEIPGTIVSVKVYSCATTSTKTDGGFTVYGGTSSSSIDTQIEEVTGLSSTASDHLVEFTGSYTFFKIVNGSARVLKHSKIDVVYSVQSGKDMRVQDNSHNQGPINVSYGDTTDYKYLLGWDIDGNAALRSGCSWTVSEEGILDWYPNGDTWFTYKPITVGSVTVTCSCEGFKDASITVNVVPGTLESIVVSGSMTKTSYYVGESWSHDGLVATGSYSTGYEGDVSSEAVWTYSAETPVVAVTSLVVTATIGEVSGSSAAQAVTVTRTNPIQVIYTQTSGSVDVYGYYVGFLDGTGPVIMDGAYGIVIYNKTADVSGYTAGETILHVTGSISIYNGLYEIGSATINVASGSYDVPDAPVVYAAKGGETADYASRLTTVTGVPAIASGSKGDFSSAAGTNDITMNFTVGSNNIQVFYKKAAQTADAEAFAAMKAAVEDSSEITVKGFTSWYNGFQVQMNGYIPPAEGYTAEDFAQDLLDQTDAVCEGWTEGKNNHDALEAIWTNLASNDKYPSLPSAEKNILAEAARDESGTVIEQAMARYDFLTGKYNLSNFINGRTPIVPAGMMRYGELADTNNTMIIVVVIAAVSALAFTTLLVFKKKKQK